MADIEVINNDDHTKTIIEFRTNDNGQRIKVTRKVRVRLVKQKAKHSVAERAHWRKFGAAGHGKASFDEGITALGEEVFLKLAVNKDFDVDEPQLTVSEQVRKLQSSKIICRVCKGDHWTTRCPYKDTLRPLEDILDKSGSAAAGAAPGSRMSKTSDDGSAPSGVGPAAAAAALAKLDSGGGPGKYVPPSMRAKAAGLGGPDGGSASPGGAGGSSSSFSSRRQDEDETTVRVTNLSEDAQEADLHALFKRFGPIQRVFLSKDRDTGLCKGFAFVNFLSRDSAAKAIQVMHGYGFDNLILNVEWSKPRQN